MLDFLIAIALSSYAAFFGFGVFLFIFGLFMGLVSGEKK